MNKQESISYLHDEKGYSRRLSARLVDIAMLQKSNKTFGIAIQEALEKARIKGAKDRVSRKKRHQWAKENKAFSQKLIHDADKEANKEKWSVRDMIDEHEKIKTYKTSSGKRVTIPED